MPKMVNEEIHGDLIWVGLYDDSNMKRKTFIRNMYGTDDLPNTKVVDENGAIQGMLFSEMHFDHNPSGGVNWNGLTLNQEEFALLNNVMKAQADSHLFSTQIIDGLRETFERSAELRSQKESHQKIA